MRNDSFSRKHPAVIFAYFSAVISLCAFFRHPVMTVVSLICSVSYSLYLNPRATRKLLLTFCLPVFLLTAVINSAFNHRGTIRLAVLPSGNALTLESIVYGAFAALMLSSLIIWFSIFSKLFTSDKIVWLAGRVFPSLALLISMTLRFVPEFRRRFSAVTSARRALEGASNKGKGKGSIKTAFSCFSTVVTWSLENAIITSDSMKSRGYGLPGRSAYSPFRFTASDAASISAILFLFAATVVANFLGVFEWHYYPAMGGSLFEPLTMLFYGIFLALCVLPLLIDGKEAAKWRFLRSTI